MTLQISAPTNGSSFHLEDAPLAQRESTAGRGVKSLVARLLPYLVVSLLSMVILIVLFRLWSADLTVPFSDVEDGVFLQAWFKCVQENGWFLHNPALGAPGGSDLYDFPMADNLHFFVVKMLALVFRSPGLLFNMYCLLMFPLVACTTLFALHRLPINRNLAAVGSLLYAFLPYHMMRMLGHVFLASYYLVPMECLLIVYLAQGRTFGFGSPDARRRLVAALVLCLLVSSAGVYYAFFGCFFYFIAGLFASLQLRSWRSLRTSILFCACTTVGVVLNLIPVFLYRFAHGRNPEAVIRYPMHAELFALKIAQLLLPASGHRFYPLAKLKTDYNNGGVLINENDAATLGIICSVGFLLLLWQLLRRPRLPLSERQSLFECLAVANLAAILLGTMGGLGSVFNLLVTAWIRSYNRISIFIAFFALEPQSSCSSIRCCDGFVAAAAPGSIGRHWLHC